MSLRISGMGWVTPLGSGVDVVWERLLQGEALVAEEISTPLNGRIFKVYRVPPEAICNAPSHPRLRRSSAISKFAVVAGLAALEDAGIKLDPASAARTAIIFAISNGGVVYTKRFFHDIVETGAEAASPLLFPETVFNAPASHLAAILGITGASYTLVGDGAVGVLAVKMADDLIQNGEVDRCLVVGAEEADWLLCDAYHRWRMLRTAPPIEVFESQPRGTILSEGAGAVLLALDGASVRIEHIEAGCNFARQNEASACVDRTLSGLGLTNDDLVIASANGTFIDQAERAAINQHAPAANIYAPKVSLGESVGASAIWQVICGAQALKSGQLPPSSQSIAGSHFRRAIVSTCGLNQQVAGLSLVMPDRQS